MPQLGLFGPITTPSRKAVSGPHMEACRGWTRLWQEARGSEFQWSPLDRRGVKLGLQRADGDVNRYLDMARDLLMNPPSKWYAQNASPMLLYSKWNELGARVVASKSKQDQRNLDALRRSMEVL